MIEEGEDELICDFAETYNIYDYRSFPIELIATLANGLRSDSRIRMKLSGEKDVNFMTNRLMIMLYDRINWIAWSRSKDGQDGINRPESIYSIVYDSEPDTEFETFESGEDFMKEWNKRIQNGNNNS